RAGAAPPPPPRPGGRALPAPPVQVRLALQHDDAIDAGGGGERQRLRGEVTGLAERRFHDFRRDDRADGGGPELGEQFAACHGASVMRFGQYHASTLRAVRFLASVLLSAAIVSAQAPQTPQAPAAPQEGEFKDLASLMASLPAATVTPLDGTAALLFSALPLTYLDHLQPRPAARRPALRH